MTTFTYWREQEKISDLIKFIGCTRILQSFRLDENEIPENTKDSFFKNKIFACVVAEFENKDERYQKLFLQIKEWQNYTSVRHVEVDWDMYQFAQLNSIKKYFFIQMLS